MGGGGRWGGGGGGGVQVPPTTWLGGGHKGVSRGMAQVCVVFALIVVGVGGVSATHAYAPDFHTM